jgi:hypothetical protein
MDEQYSAPLSIFGIKLKAIIIFLLFLILLFFAVDRSDIENLLQTTGIKESEPAPASAPEHTNDVVVDQEMLAKAMQDVQIEKLAQLENGESSVPTDRFFYIIELDSGSSLEAVDITVEPDYVIMLSQGGTQTTIKRTSVTKIHRIKLPPSKKE